MQIRLSARRLRITALAVAALCVTATDQAAMSDAVTTAKTPSAGARFRSHVVAPGGAVLEAPVGAYQAGPCVTGTGYAARTGGTYLAGADLDDNPVAPADMPQDPNAAYAGLEFYFDRRRPRTPQERRFGLRPNDFVAVDGSGKQVLFNGVPLLPVPDPSLIYADPCDVQ